MPPMMASPSIQVSGTIAQIRERVAQARHQGRTVGLVPTMGALHPGHLRLVEAARAEADFVVVSIFVNPSQFGPTEDFARYPRTLQSDLALCASGGAELAFVPEVAEIYRGGGLDTYVEVPGLGSILEGASRPGHFRGVATVVLKLLNIVGPDLAFFGAKDYQQQALIRRMVADLDVPVAIRSVATVREPDGLAMSSRNRYLGPAERRAATILSAALGAGVAAVEGGERDAERVRQVIAGTIQSEPLARLESVDVVDAETLESLREVGPGVGAVALVAARVGPARLIDNIALPGR